MYYVIFGNGVIWECKTRGEVCEMLGEDTDADYYEGEFDMFDGNRESVFVIIKGEQVHVEQVWQAAKEKK